MLKKILIFDPSLTCFGYTSKAEVSVLSPRVAFLDHQRLLLNVDNGALKQRIAALAQDKIFKDGKCLLSYPIDIYGSIFKQHFHIKLNRVGGHMSENKLLYIYTHLIFPSIAVQDLNLSPIAFLFCSFFFVRKNIFSMICRILSQIFHQHLTCISFGFFF